MTNKPNIYGTCPAGCLWETVHKDDFLRSASVARVRADESGSVSLEFGRKYKIKKTVANTTSWGFAVSATFYHSIEKETLVFNIVNSGNPATTKYEEYLTIRMCEIYLNNYEPVLACELNGVIHYISPTGNAFSSTTLPNFVEAKATATDGSPLEVFIVNDDATIEAKDGDSVFIRYSAQSDGTEFTEKWTDGQCYIGIATGQEAPTDKSGYTWLYFGSGGGGGSNTDSRLDELEKAVADLTYIEIAFTSVSITPNVAEIGSTVASAVLRWNTNKEPTSQKVDGETRTNDTSSITYSNISKDRTWTIEVTDERGTKATRNVSLSFLNGVYYGVSTKPNTYEDDSFVHGLTKNLRNSKLPSFTVTAYGEQYVYYCLPKRMGTCSFKVGGFDGGFSLVATIPFTNESGYTEDYYIYQSDNYGLGSTSVTVS